MTIASPSAETKEQQSGSPVEVLLVFLRLGVSCFGGPIAHIGYFRDEFVLRRHWINEQIYADLVGLCQFLPGPASSQVRFSIGLMRAGYRGGLAAWTGFTLPSAVALVLFAYGAGEVGGPGQITAILLGGVAGLWLCRTGPPTTTGHVTVPVSRTAGLAALRYFFCWLGFRSCAVWQTPRN